jgi:HD-like signal output (HDOD) protein
LSRFAPLIVAVLLGATAIGAAVAAWRRSRPARAAPPGPARATLPEAVAAPGESGSPAAAEAWTALHRLALSAPQLEPQVPAGHEDVVDWFAAGIDSLVAQDRHMPRRPLLLPQLVRAVNDTETSRRELAGIIARDPALAADLLRLANSPYYRISAKPVESIDRAVAVLGSEGIRRLVAAALLQPVFRAQGGHARFPDVTWDHAFRSGIAAESYAAIVDGSDPFAAQLLALLMGLGSIIVYRMAFERYGGEAPPPALIAAMIDRHAARAAHAVATSWGLSERALAALAEQRVAASARELTPLGRSVWFGRLTGALAVLRSSGAVTDDAALATLRAAGTPAQQTERIWMRLVPEAVIAKREAAM